jgi:hypothetical protein
MLCSSVGRATLCRSVEHFNGRISGLVASHGKFKLDRPIQPDCVDRHGAPNLKFTDRYSMLIAPSEIPNYATKFAG